MDKVYCSECKWHIHSSTFGEDYCMHQRLKPRYVSKDTPIHRGGHVTEGSGDCMTLNTHNDCKYFEPIKEEE